MFHPRSSNQKCGVILSLVWRILRKTKSKDLIFGSSIDATNLGDDRAETIGNLRKD